MTDIDFLLQEEVVSFIQDNLHTDVNALLLNPPSKFRKNIKIIVEQIIARRKAEGKLNQWLEKEGLIFPPPISIEQASSTSTAAYKKNLLKGDMLVDLTGGSGVDTLSLHRDFEQSIYVEQNPLLCRVFEHNRTKFDAEVQVLNQTAEEFLSHAQHRACFYIDPARRDQSKKKVFKLEECTPNILELMPLLQRSASSVLIKLSPLLDISSIIREIAHIKEIHVVAVKNDCKEVLILLDFTSSEEPTIHAVNLETKNEALKFKASQEQSTSLEPQETGKYLYEPNTAILKAGAFKSIIERYPVKHISANTHLYTSENQVNDFPGKSFKILHQHAKSHLDRYEGRINVLTRNYPLNANELKKRFRLKDGGTDFLIGFRDHRDKPQLVIAKRLY